MLLIKETTQKSDMYVYKSFKNWTRNNKTITSNDYVHRKIQPILQKNYWD